MIFRKIHIIALLAAIGLSGCVSNETKTSLATYSPYPFEDEPPKIALEENEYAPYARAIFGFEGKTQNVYFDYYRDNAYLVRDQAGNGIAAMIRQHNGDYIMYNVDGQVIFTLFLASGGRFLIMDPLGIHYGLLDYNSKRNFIARDRSGLMYHNIWFQPLFYANYGERYQLRKLFQNSHRNPSMPPSKLRTPTFDPVNNPNNPTVTSGTNVNATMDIDEMRRKSEENASMNNRRGSIGEGGVINSNVQITGQSTTSNTIKTILKSAIVNRSGSGRIPTVGSFRSIGGIRSIPSSSMRSTSGSSRGRSTSNNRQSSVTKTQHN